MKADEAGRQAIIEINRLIHEPARLAILAVLAGCESADFQFLLGATGLTKGNLSAQAIKLDEAGYVEIVKSFNGRVPATHYRLTPAGRQALGQYSQQLRLTLDQIDPEN
jgi:DNA-binding transcriptional ArsR family regulator